MEYDLCYVYIYKLILACLKTLRMKVGDQNRNPTSEADSGCCLGLSVSYFTLMIHVAEYLRLCCFSVLVVDPVF